MNRRDTLKCLSGAMLFPLLKMSEASERPMTVLYVTWVKHEKFHREHKHKNEILFVKLPSNRIFRLYVPRKGRLDGAEREGMISSVIFHDHMSSSKQRENDWIDAEVIAEQHFRGHIKPENCYTKMDLYWAKKELNEQ